VAVLRVHRFQPELAALIGQRPEHGVIALICNHSVACQERARQIGRRVAEPFRASRPGQAMRWCQAARAAQWPRSWQGRHLARLLTLPISTRGLIDRSTSVVQWSPRLPRGGSGSWQL